MNDIKNERVKDFSEKMAKIRNQNNIVAETINIKHYCFICSIPIRFKSRENEI